jgi:hypothetical protein
VSSRWSCRHTARGQISLASNPGSVQWVHSVPSSVGVMLGCPPIPTLPLGINPPTCLACARP